MAIPMRISQAGLTLIKGFEGLRLTAYKDSVGILTIGYGHTGKDVKEGDEITEQWADALLERDVLIAEKCVNGAVQVPITQGEFDALCSFVFNLGCARLRVSTLLRKLNDSDYDGAAAEFKRWNKAGGTVLAGLTRRRVAEVALFESTVT